MTPMAKDRTKCEHVARVSRTKWESPEGDYVMLELNDGMTAKGNASSADFLPGTTYRFMGRWRSNDRYGDEFHFTSFTIFSFAGRAGIVAYLSKTCEGIGQKKADKLYEVYGHEAVKVLREDPERVTADALLSADVAADASDDLQRDKHLEQTRIDLHELLHGRGFHGRIFNQAIGKWGAKAPSTIRRDPFKLMGMAGAGFKRCDQLWQHLGLPLHRLKRQMYAAINVINQDRDGHTWIPANKAAEAVRSAVGEGANPKRALRLGIRAGRLACCKDSAGEVWVALAGRADAERRIAEGIKRLTSAGVSHWPDSVPVSAVEKDGLPSQHQADEIRKATLAPVGCFIGGPGTGKTHSLSFALKEVIRTFGADNVAVCAPTGKAAVRATQSLSARGLDILATTVHSLLGIGRNGHDGAGWGFEHDMDNPLTPRVIVVDESSMKDTNLMASLFDACGKVSHVLFVGDPHQLPPVGHGAPLRDLIAAGIPTGELTEVRRNAGRIVVACQQIKDGQPVEFSPRIDLTAEFPENLRHIETTGPGAADAVVKILSAGVKGFHPVWQTQVIVALNEKGNCSRTDLNDRLQQLLNPAGIQHPKCKFRVDDKMICTKNSFLRPVVPTMHGEMSEAQRADATFYRDLGKENEVYCANGEIGRIIAVGEKSCVARFGESDTIVRIGMGKSDDDEADDTGGKKKASGGMGDFDLAYAVTCHRMQGSESPCVIVVLDESAGSVANREWHYTACSRASKLCVLVGPRSAFDKQVSKPALVRRKTFLAETIRSMRERDRRESECAS